jgi:hypothetical protein
LRTELRKHDRVTFRHIPCGVHNPDVRLFEESIEARLVPLRLLQNP